MQELFNKADELVLAYIDEGNQGYFEYYFDAFLTENQLDKMEFLIQYLQNAKDTQNADSVEFAIILYSVLKIQNGVMIAIFCKLLLEDWHYKHEDLVDILQNDRSSLDTLYKAFDVKSKSLEYNDYYSFHKKLIYAIHHIEGKASKSKLSKLAPKISPKLNTEFKNFVGNIK